MLFIIYPANEELEKTEEGVSELQITEPTSLNTDNVENESEDSDKEQDGKETGNKCMCESTLQASQW